MKQMVDELIWYVVIANFSSLKDAFLNLGNWTFAIFQEELVGISKSIFFPCNPWFYEFILFLNNHQIYLMGITSHFYYKKVKQSIL